MKNWFNTKYYHILYKDRNEQEAQRFILNLLKKLNPNKSDVFIDVACGNGRHSLFISSLGYQVFGIDLANKNILSAKAQQQKNSHFEVHDMRKVYKSNYFDFCLNLFTSFGYFENKNDDQLSINAMTDNLKKGGKLVFDFMNVKKVINELVSEEIKIVDNIKFNIKRKVENNYIIKDISFYDTEKFIFQEKVHALTLSDISELMQKAGLKIINLWGDYDLNDFDAYNSNRLIILAQK